MKPRLILALAAGLLLLNVLVAQAENSPLAVDELSTRLTAALPDYVNREYARARSDWHLVLTSNPRVAHGPGDSYAIAFVTLERIFQKGRLVPVLIDRTIRVAPSGGRWWLSDVRTVFRPIPEALDSKLGPYLGDYPKPQSDPPTIDALPPYTVVESAFSKAVTTWLRDIQTTSDQY
ncbi:hypothetical protein [Gloeobacter kilaueensis]|uniref:Uncharacterized protein n=1 Tax=Gloeobacter kilaueensis (strain ATCC BAA-2537 / CCAP 1431/1 / ULC 316 / JS1) TaxID=1183438 RepID=U5QKH8_GLOK1|nr:hypothetical protein [Gloeobacter kilaueensis]AGY59482.1 hypothetical protein GKIL_3236 [Gloeobacter kilaueensis JS1]